MSVLPIGPGLPNQAQIRLEPPRGAAEGAAGATGPIEGPAAAANAFSQLLGDAMTQMDQLQKTADANTTRLATGQPVDLHDVTIALEQANIAFQLGMQVRNKLVEAYQEVMRMPI